MPHADPETEPRDLTPAVRDRLVRLAYRFVWNRSDAEDAVHNAVALAQSRRDQLREPSRWWSWMCRIVVRQCVALGRGESRRGTRERGESPQRSVSEVRSGSDPPERAAESRERSEILRQAVAQLPPKQRAAITLRHVEGMEYERIAEVLEISPATVRGHVRDAREALRARLARELPEWADHESAGVVKGRLP